MRRRYSGVKVFTVPNSPDKIAWILLPVAFLLGGVMGQLFAGVRSGQLESVLTEYGTSVPAAEFTMREALSLLWQLFRTLMLAGILSFSALGVLGLPILLGVRGFLAAYAISALVRTWGYRGLAAAAVWVGGSNFILLALLLLITVPGWVYAWELASGGRTGRILPKNYIRSCTGICLAGMLLAVFYQWLIYHYLVPALWGGL